NAVLSVQNFIHVLLGTELFDGFSPETLMEVFHHLNHKVRQYNQGQIIHLQNEVCESMDFILTGKISIQKIDEEGNVLKVTEFRDGDILGANLLFAASNAYPMTIVAESNAIVLQLYKQLVLDLTQKSPAFTAALLAEVSNKALILTGKIDTLSFKTIREQITDFLSYQYHLQQSNVIELKMSKKDLAERFGVQRTSLSRELSKMRREGLVEFDARTITIKNPARL
ncbi:MAG TPA: Crp/Fnr family transcriptional regulator, partial [bacterium]|nr:Crp/Fnr family transcriptional regulator [bacterium]